MLLLLLLLSIVIVSRILGWLISARMRIEAPVIFAIRGRIVKVSHGRLLLELLLLRWLIPIRIVMVHLSLGLRLGRVCHRFLLTTVIRLYVLLLLWWCL